MPALIDTRPIQPLTEADVRSAVALLGRVAASRGGRPTQRKLLMDGLCEIVDADCWVWGVFEFVSEGALPGFAIQQSGGFSRERLAKYFRANEHKDLGPISDLASCSRNEIADRLGVSRHTVNGYVREIDVRFGVRSQPELMRRFFEGDGADGLHTR